MLMLFFAGMLCLVALTDIKSRVIPDKVLLGAVVVRFVYFLGEQLFTLESLFPTARQGFWYGLLALLLGGLSVSLPLLLLTVLMERVRKKVLMGGGDIKLLFVTGIYLGWLHNMIAIFLACILALFVVAIRCLRNSHVQMVEEGGLRNSRVNSADEQGFAFAPFIAAGAVIAMLRLAYI